jgi:hypothetical protein
MQTHKLLSRLATTGTRLVILATMLTAAFISSISPAAAAPISIDLYAVSATMTFPGYPIPVPIWGYNSTNGPVTQPGGPTLIVNQGDEVTITLHNQLGESTGLLIQGQDMIPDTVGAAPGGDKSYTFTASRPGTYLYGAGLLPNAQHQAAMGLYGALIVRPATAGQAYDDPTTAYDDEAVLVLSELDPVLNTRSNPATFDMRNYNPRYFLINGQMYPNTAPIPTQAGNRVLLRYLNAGIKIHSMALLGMHQTVIAFDGSPLGASHRMVAESFGSGQTVDTIAEIPASTADGSRFAIYDGNLMLRNSNLPGFGGMLTFLAVSSTPPPTDTAGPVTSNVAYVPGTLSATVDDTTTGGSNVMAAEYYLDSTSSAANPMTGAFGTPTVNVSASVTVSSGPHTLYVRGQDDQGNWGAFSSILVNGGDTTGPATTGLTLVPNPTNGSVNVALSATGDDSASGGSNIDAAEYFIDTDPGVNSATAMTVNVAAPIASLDGTISAATVNTLAEGTHVVGVRSHDTSGNWGGTTTIDLRVDKTAPTTSAVSAAPNPNNGTLPINPGTLAVRVSATLTDPLSGGIQSNISAAEGFIDTVGADGTGFVFAANDGAFDSSSETASGDIPLATIVQLSDGNHTLYVHAKDAAGNWGPTSTTTLLIDKTAPAVSGTAASPNPTLGAASVTLTATASDSGTGVTLAEWFTGADPGPGNGTAMTIGGTGPWGLSATLDVSTWADGSYNLSVRAKDAVGNWSTVSTTVLVVGTPVTGPSGLFFSTLANGTIPGVSGPYDNADIYNWNGTAFSRTWDGTDNGLPGAADVDGVSLMDATHFYLSFSTDTTLPGIGAVQDEDVVYYNNGAWSVYFDGTGLGLTAGNQDLDAIDIIGGTLYFSTLGNTNPPGLGGTADDADIYSWNGVSFARVWDASAAGLAGTADVDGLSFVDAAHFYLSFNTNTDLAGLGTVQGEDVVYYDNGTWSVYFDGTAQGLTAPQQQVDAIDVQ